MLSYVLFRNELITVSVQVAQHCPYRKRDPDEWGRDLRGRPK